MRGEAGKSTREADVGRRKEIKKGWDCRGKGEFESLLACFFTARERNRCRERVLVW